MKFSKYNIFFFIITFILCIPSLLFAESEEKIEKTYPLAMNGKVYVENISGNIIVKSWNRDEIKILARKTAPDKNSLDGASIDINRTNENIRIITRRNKSTGLSNSTNVSVHYDLFIPEKAQVRVKTISGSVSTLETGGPVDIETVSGRIEVAAAGNGVKSKTISGGIYLDKIIGDADLESTSGEIKADGIKGSVEANTVSGDIEISAISFADELEVASIKGNMEIQGELSPGGIYEFNTISGRIRVVLASLSSFELQTNTMSGVIKCDFKLNAYSIYTRNKLQGVVGNGGSSLKISSLSGDILIFKGK